MTRATKLFGSAPWRIATDKIPFEQRPYVQKLLRTCPECGERFIANPEIVLMKKQDQVYCLPRCQSRAANRRWRARNPGAAAKACRKWYHADPERGREATRRYREKKREAS